MRKLTNSLRLNRRFLCQTRGIALFILVLIGGCAGRSGDDALFQYLDGSSGATVTRLPAPLAFFKEEPMLAANARDYVYVGPAELNQSGRRELVLWMNFCSTIDRGRRPGEYDPDRVYLMLDGKPMELSRADKRLSANELSYVSPVVGGSINVYRVTRGQLRLLARAGNIRILADKGGITREYTRWRSADSGFQRFAAYIDDEDHYLLTSVDE